MDFLPVIWQESPLAACSKAAVLSLSDFALPLVNVIFYFAGSPGSPGPDHLMHNVFFTAYVALKVVVLLLKGGLRLSPPAMPVSREICFTKKTTWRFLHLYKEC